MRLAHICVKRFSAACSTFARIRHNQNYKPSGHIHPTHIMADLHKDDQDATTSAHLAVEEKAHSQGSRGKNRRGGGGRRNDGGGGGGQSREVQVSKALSRLLRHQAENAGIKLDGEGYAPLDKVLAWGPLKTLGVTLEDVQASVGSNEKQRFALKPKDQKAGESTNAADYLIRANQGHSIKLESSSLMVPLTVEEGNIPPRTLHGTYFAFWPAIVEAGGLKPMGRNHVHCSKGTPEEGVVSGMRKDAELLVEVDVEKSIREGGLKWWMSENEVILTEGGDGGMVSSKFFKVVTGRKDGVGKLWEDGEWVADLPEDLKIRTPHGKGPRGGGRGGRGRGRGGRGS